MPTTTRDADRRDAVRYSEAENQLRSFARHYRALMTGSTHACAVCGRADQPLWQLFSQGLVSQPVCVERDSCLAHLYEKKKTS